MAAPCPLSAPLQLARRLGFRNQFRANRQEHYAPPVRLAPVNLRATCLVSLGQPPAQLCRRLRVNRADLGRPSPPVQILPSCRQLRARRLSLEEPIERRQRGHAIVNNLPLPLGRMPDKVLRLVTMCP